MTDPPLTENGRPRSPAATTDAARTNDAVGADQTRDGTLRRLAAAQKPARGVSLYSRYVNRPVGRVLAAGAVRLGISAQGVTYLSALVTLTGAVLLATVRPSVALGVLVALVLALGFALDSADGQVARLTGTGSAAGEWTDHVVDAGKMVAVHAAVLVGWYRWDLADGAWLLVPIAAQLVSTVSFAGGTIADLLARAAPRPVSDAPQSATHAAPAGAPADAPRPPSIARAVALLPADYGVLCWCFVLWGATGAFRVAYTALVVLTTIVTLALLHRWFTGLRRLAR
jgi:hypothetical protein